MKSLEWTDALISRLKEMWSHGYTATQIADALGAPSRNSILGKLHRLKEPLKNNEFVWTDEAVATLKRMHAQGSTSRTIAAILQTSLYSIRGKSRYLNLSFAQVRRDHAVATRAFKTERRAIRTAERAAAFTPAPAAAPSLNMTFADLARHSCRYPTSPEDAPAMLFCGIVQREGSSYCPHHHSVAYKPAKPYVPSFPGPSFKGRVA